MGVAARWGSTCRAWCIVTTRRRTSRLPCGITLPPCGARWRQPRSKRPKLTPQGAADLFAFFYSARFFDKPGEAASGKALFESKHCGTCHGITESRAEGATPVEKWESLADPVLLVQQMWNHSFRMRQAFARRKMKWQVLTGAELNDILVYLRAAGDRHLGTRFSNTSGAGGERLFEVKGCVNCHHGELALENRLKNMTLTDIAVDMWNHAPRMLQTPPVFTQNEMRELLSYLWMRQLVRAGRQYRGRRKGLHRAEVLDAVTPEACTERGNCPGRRRSIPR